MPDQALAAKWWAFQVPKAPHLVPESAKSALLDARSSIVC